MTDPQIPPVPRLPREAMTPVEDYYYRVLLHWYRYRRAAPSLDALQKIVKPHRSRTAIRSGLLSLERKRYVKRNTSGHFEVIK